MVEAMQKLTSIDLFKILLKLGNLAVLVSQLGLAVF